MLPIPEEIGVAPDTDHSTSVTAQLSENTGVSEATGTTAAQLAVFELIATLAGQVRLGTCVSTTVTVNEQVVEFVLWSTTLQVTVVVPRLNERPFRLVLAALKGTLVAPVSW